MMYELYQLQTITFYIVELTIWKAYNLLYLIQIYLQMIRRKAKIKPTKVNESWLNTYIVQHYIYTEKYQQTFSH